MGRNVLGQVRSDPGQERRERHLAEQKDERGSGTRPGQRHDSQEMPDHRSRPPRDLDLSSECRGSRPGPTRSRTTTACPLTVRLFHALCGGSGTATAWSAAPTPRGERVSGCSAPSTVLVQDRRKRPGTSERQRATSRKFTGKARPLFVQIHQ